VLTASAAELLEATVTAAGGRSVECEPLRVPRQPLDVLCQQLLGMAAQRPWSADEAFELVRRAYPYRDLARDDFDGCLDYLSGRRRNGEGWLPARLSWSGDEFALVDARTARLVRRNLGTIIADEPRPVMVEDGSAPVTADEFPDSGLRLVGHVDEPFADRLNPGDRFLLDGRCLEYRGADGCSLLTTEVCGRPAVPVWAGEGWPLSAELARRLFLLRTRAADALRDGPEALAALLRREYELSGPAVDILVRYFQRQECVSEVPDAAACLVEVVADEAGGGHYVHTPLNRKGNDALARVLVRRLARAGRRVAASVVADLGFAVFPVDGPLGTPQEFRRLLSADQFEGDLDAALLDSDALRERFRRAALTGLMLLRNPAGRRRKVGGRDWAERRLFEQVREQEPGFVLLRQALAEVREDCCDAAAGLAYLGALPGMQVRFRYLPQVSPFAESWTQQGTGPAEMLDSPAEALQRLHRTLSGGVVDHAG
jgi:ATP-dependent Lhr-like helicase